MDTEHQALSPSQTFLVSNTLMSNAIVDLVADANDKAVAMLQSGERDEAIAFFSRAIEAIQQSVNMSSFPGELPDITCRYSPTRSLNFKDQGAVDEEGGDTNTLIVSVASGDYELAESQTVTHDNVFSFYNHAFVFESLPGTVTTITQQESRHERKISAILIFNLALTFYGKGICGGGPYLRKALQLYTMTISLISDEAGFEDLHAIELASWNNIGHIYCHLAEHENAGKCRVHLYQALFADPATSLRLMYGFSYALLYLFVVCSEVRRREMRSSLGA
jgi:tetratricopeptide (TPR) repeat protein